MARTKIAVVSCTMSAGRTRGSGTAVDQSNGMYIDSADLYPETVPVQRGARLLLLEVYNTDTSDHAITIKAGNSNPPAFRKDLGDLSVTVTHSSTVPFIIGPLESARFLQDTQKINVDFAASFAGTIYAYVLDKSV